MTGARACRKTLQEQQYPMRIAFIFVAITLAICTLTPARAFGEESDENLVDPTQRADNSFIYDTTIESLFEQASLYDDRTVQVVGEVIGDRIVADRYGKYGVTGTILQVRGTYHQACSEHDGLPDIHVANSSVMSKGVDHPDELNLSDFVPGILAIIIGAALMGAFYYARERTR